jgi:hypothetical protein
MDALSICLEGLEESTEGSISIACGSIETRTEYYRIQILKSLYVLRH